MNVRVFKAANDFDNRVDFANVTEKLISQTLAGARAFDQAGDIDKLDRRRRDFFRARNRGDLFQSRVRHGHHADIGVNRAERIILRWRFMRAGNSVEQRRFPDVWQSDNSSAKHDKIKTSGWRDLNPRPVAAASVLTPQAIQLVPATPRFKISLLSYSFNA